MCRTTMRQVQAETKVPQNKARESSISAFSSVVRDKVICLDHGDAVVGFCGSMPMSGLAQGLRSISFVVWAGSL